MVARGRTLDPIGTGPIYHAATLAEHLGDVAGVSRAVRELRERGGRIGAADGDLLRHGDAALQNELATASLASFAPGSALDSVNEHQVRLCARSYDNCDLFFRSTQSEFSLT